MIVYQDQVLLILQEFAGYTLGAADIVRKAMGKKIPALMAQEREKFNAGAASKGYDEETATAIFDLIEPFAGYAFNKAHSVSYALISYWTAWFKTHHPTEYMAAVLNARRDNPDRVASSINESLCAWAYRCSSRTSTAPACSTPSTRAHTGSPPFGPGSPRSRPSVSPPWPR